MKTVKLLVAVCCLSLCGCNIVEYLRPEGPPSDKEIYASYNQTKLKESNAAVVLVTINNPRYELLSQSKNVIASQGQKKESRKIWFNIVAFDEKKTAAERKYFFIVDERPRSLSIQPSRRLVFESEVVLEKELLDKPYANENARRIAILEQILKSVRKDVDEVAVDNKKIGICGMLINQTMRTILRQMNESPVQVSKLDDPNGVDFDHITLGKGRITMNVTEDIANMKIDISRLSSKMESPFSIEE